MLDAEAQGRGASRRARLIVLRAPFWHACSLTDAERAVDDDTRRRVAVVERGRVDDRLEGRAWLAARLHGAIELASSEAETADKREHAPGVWVHGHHRTADLRHLLERPLPGDVRLLVGRLARARTHAVLELGPGPRHFGEGDRAGLPLVRELAGRATRRPQADLRGALIGLKHHGKTPRIDIRPHIDGGKCLAPIAVEVDLLYRAAPAMAVIVGDKTVDESLSGDLLQSWVERRAHREAAAVEPIL